MRGDGGGGGGGRQEPAIVPGARRAGVVAQAPRRAAAVVPAHRRDGEGTAKRRAVVDRSAGGFFLARTSEIFLCLSNDFTRWLFAVVNRNCPGVFNAYDARARRNAAKEKKRAMALRAKRGGASASPPMPNVLLRSMNRHVAATGVGGGRAARDVEFDDDAPSPRGGGYDSPRREWVGTGSKHVNVGGGAGGWRPRSSGGAGASRGGRAASGVRASDPGFSDAFNRLRVDTARGGGGGRDRDKPWDDSPGGGGSVNSSVEYTPSEYSPRRIREDRERARPSTAGAASSCWWPPKAEQPTAPIGSHRGSTSGSSSRASKTLLGRNLASTATWKLCAMRAGSSSMGVPSTQMSDLRLFYGCGHFKS